MKDNLLKSLSLLFFVMLGVTSCRPAGEQAQDNQKATDAVATTIARSTKVALAKALVNTGTPSPSPTIFQPTETTAPPNTVTATPVPPLISVSVNTNCRTGPDSSYDFRGALSVGEEAEIAAKSDVDGYWYIVNPDDPDGYCWLWDEYASIVGETGGLPVYTPEPSPTPFVGFDVWFHGFEPCGGSQTAIFAIRNGGAVRIWSGWVAVYALDPLDGLYGPARERHPFADRPLPACPPGHGNELYPGEVRFIHAPLSSLPHGRNAYAEITLCSADHQGGDCVTKVAYFYIP